MESTVKKHILPLFASFLLAAHPTYAAFDLEDVSTESMPDYEQKAQEGPFTVTVLGDWIGKAKVHKDGYHGNIQYAHAELDTSLVVWYNECCKEGVAIGLNYEFTRLKWNDNIFFTRENYPALQVAATYFTERVPCWKWVAQAAFNIDADKWNFDDYTWYDLLLFGRYEYCPDFGLFFGIYAETGLKLDRVLPVLGFDWTINRCWQLNAVFPLNMSLIYTWNDRWTFDAAIRLFSDRRRAGHPVENDPIPGFDKAVWRYSNSGLELGANYNHCDWIKANVHAGYSFGGKLKVANRHTHDSHRVKFDGAPYVGANVSVNF
jgi:hypothetical protein